MLNLQIFVWSLTKVAYIKHQVSYHEYFFLVALQYLIKKLMIRCLHSLYFRHWFPQDLLTLVAAFAEARMWRPWADTWMWFLAQHFTSKGGINAEVKARNILPPSRNHLPPTLGVEPRISGSHADIATVEPFWPPFWRYHINTSPDLTTINIS